MGISFLLGITIVSNLGMGNGRRGNGISFLFSTFAA